MKSLFSETDFIIIKNFNCLNICIDRIWTMFWGDDFWGDGITFFWEFGEITMYLLGVEEVGTDIGLLTKNG